MSIRSGIKAPPFVMLKKDLLKDPDWKKLTNSAKILWIYLRAKYNYKTKGNVTLAYSEMIDMMSTRTVSNALKELIDNGWIEKIKQGGLYGGLCSYRFIGKHKEF